MSLLEVKVHYSQLQLQHVIEARVTLKSYINSLPSLAKERYKKQLKLVELPVEHLPLWKSNYIMYHAHLESIEVNMQVQERSCK